MTSAPAPCRRTADTTLTGLALREENNRLLALLAAGRSAALLDPATLTPRERTHARRAVADGEHARAELVRLNERLVRHWTRRYLAPGIDPDDLHQAGLAGLLHGIDRFDLSRGFQLSTYVSWWIRQACQRHTDRALRTRNERSLDAAFGTGAQAGADDRSLHDVLADRLAVDPAEHAADAADLAALRSSLASALEHLPAQERLALDATLAGTKPSVIAASLKLSPEALRRLVTTAWAKLRHPALHLLPPAEFEHEPGVVPAPRRRTQAVLGVVFEDPPPRRTRRVAASPPLKPGTAYEHGTRPRYVLGPDEHDNPRPCRCEPCRAANRAYARERDRRVRAGDRRTAATPVREHLAWLASHGVGKRAIATASGVALSAIDDIRAGRTRLVDQATATRLLAVTPSALAPGALVDAAPAHALVERLLAAGWTKAAIARALGSSTPALQLGRTRVKAETLARLTELVAAHAA